MTDKTNPWALVPRSLLKPFFEDWELSSSSISGSEEGVNVYETDEDVVVEAMVPGVSPEEIDVTIDNNLLTVKAGTKVERKEEDKKRRYYLRGWQQRQFFYQVQLPAKVDPDKAKADIKDGILKITLPKREEAKSKKIKVSLNK